MTHLKVVAFCNLSDISNVWRTIVSNVANKLKFRAMKWQLCKVRNIIGQHLKPISVIETVSEGEQHTKYCEVGLETRMKKMNCIHQQ